MMGNGRGFWSYVLAAVVALGVVAVMVWATRRVMTPPPLNAERVAERYKALEEVRATAHQVLTTPAWINRDKGIVRLPVDVAMQVVEREWRDPAAARSNLIERVRAAHAAPPAPPAQPSPYE
ncbi:hypothetical protein [Limisphaera sp. VF-2]|jgi:uncharacterized protein YfaT (DUF1175 family)|uniref:hypothetical protein n=1 Tax=Limisphaera sp. VF-2 TaxID=3400418 RepID=UPI00176095BD